MEYNPKDYQTTALQWMLDKPKSALFMDMGLGKTVVSLTGINILKYGYFEIQKTLIIGPKKVVEMTWEQEAQEWNHLGHLRFSKILGNEQQRKQALKTDADIYLINAENVVWLCQQFGGGHLPFDMLIIDESSLFKNHTSKRFKALQRVSASIQRVVLLTGTPAPRGYINLWSQLYLLDQGERLGKNITAFRGAYFSPGRQLSNGVITNYCLRPGADTYIQELIKDVCISMQAKDFLQLPPCMHIVDEIPLPPNILEQYHHFEANSVLEIINQAEENREIEALTASALTNKLLQFSSGAVYYEEYNEETERNERDFEIVHDEKIQKLIEIIENANGKSVLIAYNFQHSKERILKALLNKYQIRILASDQDKKDWNEGKIHILMGHPKSIGHGLNIQKGGNIAVWFDLTFDLELYDQFNARLHRQGQTETVYLHHIICEGTEDKRVLNVLRSKGSMQQALKDSLSQKIEKYKKLFNK